MSYMDVTSKVKRPLLDFDILHERGRAENKKYGPEPYKVLLFTIIKPDEPIDVDVIHKICTPFARVVRIVIFRTEGVQAMVEFDDIETASRVKDALNGEDIYADCCTLKIEFAKPQLTVLENNEDSWDYASPDFGDLQGGERQTKKPLLQEEPMPEASPKQNTGYHAPPQALPIQDPEYHAPLPRSSTKPNPDYRVPPSRVSPKQNSDYHKPPPQALPKQDPDYHKTPHRAPPKQDPDYRKRPPRAPSEQDPDYHKPPPRAPSKEDPDYHKPPPRAPSKEDPDYHKPPPQAPTKQDCDDHKPSPNAGQMDLWGVCEGFLNSCATPLFSRRSRYEDHKETDYKHGLPPPPEEVSQSDNGSERYDDRYLASQNRYWESRDALESRVYTHDDGEMQDKAALRAYTHKDGAMQGKSGSRAYTHDNGAMQGKNDEVTSVLLVYNLNPQEANCNRLFNLFCLYGNVIRVKFFKTKEDIAMVEMADSASVERCIKYLQYIPLFGRVVKLGYATETHLTVSSREARQRLPDNTPAFKDYTEFKLGRFDDNAPASKYLLDYRTKRLHFFDTPGDFTEQHLLQIFDALISYSPQLKKPIIVRFFHKKEKKTSGTLDFETVEEAVTALVYCNHAPVSTPESSKFPCRLKLSFFAPIHRAASWWSSEQEDL